MLLSIKEMELRKVTFAETWQQGEFVFANADFVVKGPLTATGVAALLPHTGEEVEVKGRVTGDIETECDRCLGRASFHIDTTFDLFYKPQTALNEGPADEIALDEGEAEMGFYELPGLELEDIIREQLLLKLPMQRVCREDCKGICPICGVNRNETACSCQTRSGDDRWMPLKNLHI